MDIRIALRQRLWSKMTRRPPSSRGVTLVELLVVIAILMMVTAAAIPIVAPTIQQRRIREATRLVSSYLAAARSRAIESGRPVGVIVQRFTPGNVQFPPFSMNLATAESPPPYAGDYTGSTMQMYYATPSIYITGFPSGDVVANQRIRIGDRVRLDYQGPYFVISGGTLDSSGIYLLAPSSTNHWTLTSDTPYLPSPLITTSTTLAPVNLPFQIIRQPVRTADPPLQLPEGIVIDLQWSGMSTAVTGYSVTSASGSVGGVFTGSADPIITFQPSGALGVLYDVSSASAVPQYPTGSIYLLLGRREQVIQPLSTTGQNNLGDLNSLWVEVSAQTGQVTVTPNTNATFSSNNGYVGYESTAAAISADIIAARTGLNSGPVTTQGGN